MRPTRTIAGFVATMLVVASVARAQSAEPKPTQPQTPEATPPRVDEPLPEAVLYFRDGRRVEGLLVREEADQVTVRIAGMDTTFDMREIERVSVLPPLEERYRSLRAVIDDTDIERLLVLVDWLREQGAYAWALEELQHLRTIDPANQEVERLWRLVESQLKLDMQAAERRAENRQDLDGESPDESGGVPRRPRRDFPLLSLDQVNLIKVYELNLDDPSRLSVDDALVEDLVRAYAGHELIPSTVEGREALARRSPERIVELLFRLKARDFYPRVTVDGEPRTFELFRKNVHAAWLVNQCSTNSCHGGQEAGRLWLNNVKPNSQRTIYTNFLILDRFRLADGTALVNHAEPARSPLLHLGLPREVSLYPHPLVAPNETSRWRPTFGSVDDRRFTQAVEWINSLYKPRPDYPVTYEPPVPDDGVPDLPPQAPGER